MQPTNLQTINVKKPLSTEQLADLLCLQPQSIRKRYSQKGSYFGIAPVKLPNGRLAWPYDQVVKLLEGESA